MTAPSVSIDHLQSRLVSMLEAVRNHRIEDPALRAEVLLAMNQLCSPGMLLGLWQTLETVGPREEILVVRLLRDMESARIESATAELIADDDPLVRSVGYGVVALRSRPAGAALLVEAFAREPGVVLKRGGRRHLAPHSFVTCMLAGIREFKDPDLDAVAMRALEGFAEGREDLATIKQLLEETRPDVARLGFVSLASRFMGKLHRFAYEDVVCNAPYTLTTAQRRWMQRALSLAPEVVEAIAEAGPTGVGDADFIRARIKILRQFAGDAASDQVDQLLAGTLSLRSVALEDPDPRRGGTPRPGTRLSLRRAHRPPRRNRGARRRSRRRGRGRAGRPAAAARTLRSDRCAQHCHGPRRLLAPARPHVAGRRSILALDRWSLG